MCEAKLQRIIIALQGHHGKKARSHPGRCYLPVPWLQSPAKKYLLSEPGLFLSGRKEEMVQFLGLSFLVPKECHGAWALIEVLPCAPENALHTPHPSPHTSVCLFHPGCRQFMNRDFQGVNCQKALLQLLLCRLTVFGGGWSFFFPNKIHRENLCNGFIVRKVITCIQYFPMIIVV